MKLIKDIKEVMNVIPVPMTSRLEVIKPYFTLTERSLVQLIGKDQFDKIVLAYEDPATVGKIKEAIEYSQNFIVNLGYLTAIPILSVDISSAGILINAGADTKQAFSWQVGEVKRSLRELGFGAIEALLELLESDADVFPEYHASEEYKKQKQYLISSAADFSDHYNIGGSRYVFHSLAYIMKRIEEQSVKPLFGAAFIETLRIETAEDPFTPAKINLLDNYLKPGIALLTAAKALRERIITFENGVAMINLHGNYDSAKKEMAADRETVDAAFNQLTEDGNRYLQDGLTLITESIIDFPGFVAPVSRRKWNFKNDRDKGIYAS